MVWTSVDQKDYTFSQIRRIMELFSETKEKLEINMNKKITDKNIGIDLNNKMVEMYNFYGNRGLDFFDSSLYQVIYNYLRETFATGLMLFNATESYVSSRVNKIEQAEEYNKLIAEATQILKPYEKLCDKIFEFSIENDIEKAVDFDVKFSEELSQNGGYNMYKGHKKELFTKYNEELERLGLSTKLQLPEEDVEIIEFSDLTEEQANAFKALQKEYDEIESDLSTFKI